MGVAFWTILTLVGSAFPVQLPRGTHQAVAVAPIMASMFLGGPAVGGWVAAIGTTEMRELRGRIPWYGTLANHAGLVIPAVLAGALREDSWRSGPGQLAEFVTAMVAAAVFMSSNLLLASLLLGLRTGQPVLGVLVGDSRGISSTVIALAPLAWLMTVIYAVQWWATALFAVPLYSTRLAYQRFVEMRDMFTQTIGALAEAVDKRDPYTAKHSRRVKEISVDIGRVMRVSDAELEALEWGGLLHDVGKIGVPDNVLLKQERLTKEERIDHERAPGPGRADHRAGHQARARAADHPAPPRVVQRLGLSGPAHRRRDPEARPDPPRRRRLRGDDRRPPVPHDAADAEQALGELRKFAGIQFDPVVVDAFVKTHWVEGVSDPGRTVQPRPIPLIGQAAARMAGAAPAEATQTAKSATEHV